MDLNFATIQDCIDMQEVMEKRVILNDGNVIGFEEENKMKKIMKRLIEKLFYTEKLLRQQMRMLSEATKDNTDSIDYNIAEYTVAMSKVSDALLKRNCFFIALVLLITNLFKRISVKRK